MRYYIDTEFDGFRGPLISMALVREDGRSVYFIIDDMDRPRALQGKVKDKWVIDNVLPILRDCPEPPWVIPLAHGGPLVAEFIEGDPAPVFVADWPDDIRHVCDLLHVSPGVMPETVGVLRFEVHRVDAPPLPGMPRHNAWNDAVALRAFLESDTVAP